jgi:hypothetical protein
LRPISGGQGWIEVSYRLGVLGVLGELGASVEVRGTKEQGQVGLYLLYTTR